MEPALPSRPGLPGSVLWDVSWQVLRLAVGSWPRSGPVSTPAPDSLRTWWFWHLEVVRCPSCPDPLCPPESAAGSRACPSKLGPDAPVPTCPGCSNSWSHATRLEGGRVAARPADFPCPGQRPLPALHSGPRHRGPQPQAGWKERGFVWSWQTRASLLAPPGQAGPQHTGVWGSWSGREGSPGSRRTEGGRGPSSSPADHPIPVQAPLSLQKNLLYHLVPQQPSLLMRRPQVAKRPGHLG